MLSILTLATSVHILGSGTSELPRGDVATSNSKPANEILNTLSEVYLNSPKVKYLDSDEDPTYQYFEDVDGKEDETWLFQDPEDCVDIPEPNSEIYHEEIECQMDEIDEEMERCWLIDEPDQVCNELDGVCLGVEFPEGASEEASKSQNAGSTVPNRKEVLLSDLKIQFKRLIQYGYLEESGAVKSLINGAFDHLLAPEEKPMKPKAKVDMSKILDHSNDFFGPKQSWEYHGFSVPEVFTKGYAAKPANIEFDMCDKVEYSNDVFGPKQPWEYPRFPVQEVFTKRQTSVGERAYIKGNGALDIFRGKLSDVSVCQESLDEKDTPSKRNSPRLMKSYHQNFPRPIYRKNSLQLVSPKNSLRPIHSTHDTVETPSNDIMVIDDTPFAFKDVSKLRVIELRNADHSADYISDADLEDNNEAMDAEADYAEDREVDGGSALLESEDNWPYWNVDEDGVLYDY